MQPVRARQRMPPPPTATVDPEPRQHVEQTKVRAPVRSREVHAELLQFPSLPEFVSGIDVTLRYGDLAYAIRFDAYRMIARTKSIVNGESLDQLSQTQTQTMSPEHQKNAFYQHSCDMSAVMQFTKSFQHEPLNLIAAQNIGLEVSYAPNSRRYHENFVFEVFRAAPRPYRVLDPESPNFGPKEGIVVIGDDLSATYLGGMRCDPSRGMLVVDYSDGVHWTIVEVALEIPYARFLRLIDLQLSDPVPVVPTQTRSPAAAVRTVQPTKAKPASALRHRSAAPTT